MRPILFAGTALILVATLVGSAEGPGAPLTTATDLVAEPGGARLAVLLPGAQVRPLESRDGWTRVAVEGWIRSDDSPALPPAAPPAQAPPPAAPADPAAQDSSIAGSIFVTGERGATAVGGNLAVRLIADPQAAGPEVAAIRAECDAARAALKAQADALKAEGDRALSTIENSTRAFEAYDTAKSQRAAKLREMQKSDQACDARVEKALDGHTAQRALSNAEGRYLFEHVPPGRYTLHATLESGGARHGWDIEITAAPGQRLALDLTNANRTTMEPLPRYR